MDQTEPKHQPLEGSQQRDEPLVSSVGDLVLTDPQALRALADPFRLALLERLQRHSPATDAELSSTMQASRSSIQEHLHELERFGLITRRDVAADAEERRWCAVAKGIFFEIPTDPEGQAAARQLSNAMFLRSVDLPRRWVADAEPELELEWVRAAGLFNARVMVTPDELRSIQEGLERLLEPFTTRKSDDIPAAAAHVRILSYFMPEAAPAKVPSPVPPT